MRIIILIPVYKRPEVLDICVNNLQWFMKSVSWEIHPVFVLSPEDEYLKENQKIIRKARFKDIYYQNMPVGKKMNAGIYYVSAKYDYDYLMNFGSDDLIHPRIEQLYQPFFDKKVSFFGINALYFYELSTRKTIYFHTYNANGSIGAGRMIHKSIIDQFTSDSLPIYEPGLDCGLDTSSAMMIKRTLSIYDIIIDPGEFPYIVDIKTDTNINHMMYLETRTRNIKHCQPDFLKQYYAHI